MRSAWQLNIVVDHDDATYSATVERRLRECLTGRRIARRPDSAPITITRVENAGRLGDAA